MSDNIYRDEHLVRERKHRLGEDSYKGYAITSYTLCLEDRKRVFTEERLFHTFEKHLHLALEKYSSAALVYLFMPDHCHLLLQGKDTNADTRKAVVLFKQTTGYWLSKNYPMIHWQKDFYDHILRKEEDLNKQIQYILLNPVRGELTDSWHKYPFKGSTVFNLEEWGKNL